MEEDSINTRFIGNLPQFKPKSKEDFEINKDKLISKLFEFPFTPLPFLNSIPTKLSLSQNYPNPFNPMTTISFDLPVTTHCELNIYNIRGQLVKTLIKNKLQHGKHKVVWNGTNEEDENISSGVYFYSLVTKDKESLIKKLILLK